MNSVPEPIISDADLVAWDQAKQRLLALTIPVTNVVLKIDPSYPFGEELRPYPDPRDDRRIALAVERLFGRGIAK